MQAQITAEAEDRLRSRDKRWLVMIGRLKAGAQAEQAQKEFEILAAQLRQEYPQEHRGLAGIHVSPHVGLGPLDYPVVARFLGTALAIVGLVLLIACANVANLCWRAQRRGAKRWRFDWLSARAECESSGSF